MHVLPFETRVRIAAALVEGNSIRATERLVGVHRDSVMRFGVQAGEGCARLHNEKVHGLYSALIECDEIWAYVGQKQGRIPEGTDDSQIGDQYTFVAICATSKVAISHLTGKRTGENATTFAHDIRARVIGAPQFSTDGFKPYVDALSEAFGSRYHHGTEIKVYQGEGTGTAQHRYAPGRVISVERSRVYGTPDEHTTSTAFAERQNLTMRMHMRRFTRLTNGFSKRLTNLRAAVSLHFGWYNWVRPHETLRVTPAMAAGLTDHVWTLAELLEMALTSP